MSRCARFLLIPLLLLAVACNTDPRAASQRLVENGNKFYNKDKFKEASIMYRRAIGKDAKNGEAYYRLGLTALKLGSLGDAASALRRAVDQQPNNADAATKLAEIYWLAYISQGMTSKQFVPEINELAETLLKRDPKSFDGLRLKGYLALADKDVPAALEKFEAANKVKPNDPQLSLVLAATLSEMKRPEEAEKIAKDTIAKNPKFGPMYDFLLGMYWQQHRVEDGEKLLQSKVANNPAAEGFRVQLAMFYYGLRRSDDMEKTLQGILADKKDFPTGHLTVGRFFGRNHDYDRARREFEAGMQSDPNNKSGYQTAMVELLAVQSKFQEAIVAVNEILKENPKDSVALELRSALAVNSGDQQMVSRAVLDLQSLVSQNPNNAVLQLQLGRALMAKNQPDEARTHLEEANRLRAHFTPAKLLLAQIFSQKGDHTRALQMADEAIKEQPRNIGAHLVRTSALLGIGDRAHAKEELQAILKAVPNSADAKYQLGYINFTEKNYKEALSIFGDMMQQNPGDFRGMVGMVETEVAQGDYKGAIQRIDAALVKDPARQDLRLALGNVLARSEQYDAAIQQFQLLVEKNPKSSDLETKLGETYRLKGDFNAAVDHFRKATTLAPNNIVPLLRVAQLLDGVGRRSEAKPIYEQVIRLEPDNVVALNNLAFIKAEEGTDLDQALAYAQRAKQKVPKDPNISDTLGWIYIKKNLSEDAVRVFQELVAQVPNNPTFRYHLAMALFQKGDRPSAKQECEAALRVSPSKDEQAKIKELMAKIG